MRILGAARLSHSTDESTSIERQREVIELTVGERGDQLVAITEDADVSGAVSPFLRGELGPWLAEPARLGQWDGRGDLNDLVKWCQANGKTLVLVSESIDLGTASGRRFAKFLGLFAEFERERIGERRADHARKARSLARWDGRVVPPGYRPVKVDSHHELEPDPVLAGVIREIAALIIGGRSARQVAVSLRERGGPSARGGRWDVGTILPILRNPSLRGYVMHAGEPVRGEDGMPVQRTPILDDQTWHQLQARLDANGSPGSGVRAGAALLLGVIHCAECGHRLYISRRGWRGTGTGTRT